MGNTLRMGVFALAVVAFFAGFANFGVPQIEPAAPPARTSILDLAAMTMPQFISLGGDIFTGKGNCTLCHNEVGGRAPPLGRIALEGGERIALAEYAGAAADAEEYMLESLLDPSAYVVPGFGRANTNDTVSPMPNGQSDLGLSDAEMLAVVAYLQDLAGVEVTVDIPVDAAPEEEQVAAAAAPRPPHTDPLAIIEEFFCAACHTIAGTEAEFGPDLTAIGATRDREYLRRALLDPNADIAEDFTPDIMPPDYGDMLYAKELELLVEYLAAQQ